MPPCPWAASSRRRTSDRLRLPPFGSRHRMVHLNPEDGPIQCQRQRIGRNCLRNAKSAARQSVVPTDTLPGVFCARVGAHGRPPRPSGDLSPGSEQMGDTAPRPHHAAGAPFVWCREGRLWGPPLARGTRAAAWDAHRRCTGAVRHRSGREAGQTTSAPPRGAASRSGRLGEDRVVGARGTGRSQADALARARRPTAHGRGVN